MHDVEYQAGGEGYNWVTRSKLKYKNIRAQVNGHRFASIKEANRYQELLLLEKAGQIEGLKLQKTIKLRTGEQYLRYDSDRIATYRADFEYRENGKRIIEDTKGFSTPLYRLKKAILRNMGIEVVET